MALPAPAQPMPEAGPPRWRATAPEPAPEPFAYLDGLPRRLLFWQVAAIALLGTLHAVVTWAPPGTHHTLLTRLVDLDREMNLPTWFASAQWMIVALTLVAISVVTSRNARSRLRPFLWALSASAAFYFSADEVAVLHERLGTVLEEIASASPEGSRLRILLRFPSYYWIAAYAPLFVPAVVCLAVFFWRELGRARGMALLGIFVFLYAAVGLDFIEGHYGGEHHARLPIMISSRRFEFDIFLLEETLEMLGVAFVLRALQQHLGDLLSRDKPRTR